MLKNVWYSGLVEKYNVSWKKHLQQGISEPEFYGDLVYRLRKRYGKIYFFRTIKKLKNVIKELDTI